MRKHILAITLAVVALAAVLLIAVPGDETRAARPASHPTEGQHLAEAPTPVGKAARAKGDKLATATVAAALNPPEPKPEAEAPAQEQTQTASAPKPSGGGGGGGGCTGMESESGNDYGAVNPSSGAYGCYQIMPSTAAAHGCSLGSPAGQDACAQKICATQGPSAWTNSAGQNPCGRP